MLVFRHLMAVSTGAVIALGYCIAASSQQISNVAKSDTDQSTAPSEKQPRIIPTPEIASSVVDPSSSVAVNKTDKLTIATSEILAPRTRAAFTSIYPNQQESTVVNDETAVIPVAFSPRPQVNQPSDFAEIPASPTQVNIEPASYPSQLEEKSTTKIYTVAANPNLEPIAEPLESVKFVPANDNARYLTDTQLIANTEETATYPMVVALASTPNQPEAIETNEILVTQLANSKQKPSNRVIPTLEETSPESSPGKKPPIILPEENSPINPLQPLPESITDQVSIPDTINPSVNPLLFPTDPEEVQIGQVYAISLKQVIELANRNNRDLEVAQLQMERSQEVLQQALAAEFPTLSGQLQFQRGSTPNAQLNREAARDNAQDQIDTQIQQAEDFETQADDAADQATADTLRAQAQQIRDNLPSVSDLVGEGEDITNTQLSGTIALNYNLYTGGSRPAQIKAAEESIRLQELVIEQISEQTRFSAASLYYALQDSDAQVNIQEAAVEDATQSLRDAELLEQAGLGTRFSVLQAEVDLANSKQQLILARANQRTAQRQLVEFLSLAQDVELTAGDEIEVAGGWDMSLDQSIVMAYKNRSELEQQLVQRRIEEQQREVQLSSIRPQVSLFANYNVLEAFDDELGPNDGYALGATLNWTFFDGGAARAAARQEELDGSVAEVQFADQRNQVRLEVETAYFDLQANNENIQTAAVAVELAQESLRLARLRFQAGVGTQTDVINAQTDLTRARGNLLSAIIDYNQALNSLQRAVSNLPDGRLFDTP